MLVVVFMWCDVKEIAKWDNNNEVEVGLVGMGGVHRWCQYCVMDAVGF